MVLRGNPLRTVNFNVSPNATVIILHEIMFRVTLLRAAEATSAAIKTPINNPYRAQKQWPPDFTKINAKHQFRLERRYRRRAKLKYARPTWMKFTRLLQLGGCSCMSHALLALLFQEF